MKKKDDKLAELARLLRDLPDDLNLEKVLKRFPELKPGRLGELLVFLAEEIQVPAPVSQKGGGTAVQERLLAVGAESGRKGSLRIDGASRGNPGPSAAAAILETADGKAVEEVGLSLGRQTNNHAEYRALIIGLETALKHGFGTLQVYSDSQLLVRQMTGEYKVRHPEIAVLKEQADLLVERFKSVGFHHVPREQNSHADALANKVLDGRWQS